MLTKSTGCQTLKPLQGKETRAANEGAYLIRTGDFAKQSSGSGGAAPESIGFDSQQRSSAKPSSDQPPEIFWISTVRCRRPCTAGSSVRYRQSAKSRPANQRVCRLRESFRFQRELVAPARRCSGATASPYVTDFAARVDEVSRNFNFSRSCSGNFCVCGVCQWSEGL